MFSPQLCGFPLELRCSRRVRRRAIVRFVLPRRRSDHTSPLSDRTRLRLPKTAFPCPSYHQQASSSFRPPHASPLLLRTSWIPPSYFPSPAGREVYPITAGAPGGSAPKLFLASPFLRRSAISSSALASGCKAHLRTSDQGPSGASDTLYGANRRPFPRIRRMQYRLPCRWSRLRVPCPSTSLSDHIGISSSPALNFAPTRLFLHVPLPVCALLRLSLNSTCIGGGISVLTPCQRDVPLPSRRHVQARNGPLPGLNMTSPRPPQLSISSA